MAFFSGLEKIRTLYYVKALSEGNNRKKRLISSGLELTVMKHDDDDCFYIALFSALEQTHCAPPVILNK